MKQEDEKTDGLLGSQTHDQKDEVVTHKRQSSLDSDGAAKGSED